jgi:hypothetical protein
MMVTVKKLQLTLYVLDGTLCSEGIRGAPAALVLEIAQHAQACAEQLKKVYESDRIKTLRAELARRQEGA